MITILLFIIGLGIGFLIGWAYERAYWREIVGEYKKLLARSIKQSETLLTQNKELQNLCQQKNNGNK